MPTPVEPEVVPLAQLVSPRWGAAADLLERALKAGCQDANVIYMLAMACKRQGKMADARNALRKLLAPGTHLPPDANVLFLTVMATKMPFVGRG